MNDCIDCEYWNNAHVMCTHPFGDHCVDGRSLWQPKQSTTNGGRIRAMSDGELARFLMDSFACSLNCPAYDICDAEGACVEFLAKWLQREAE